MGQQPGVRGGVRKRRHCPINSMSWHVLDTLPPSSCETPPGPTGRTAQDRTHLGGSDLTDSAADSTAPPGVAAGSARTSQTPCLMPGTVARRHAPCLAQRPCSLSSGSQAQRLEETGQEAPATPPTLEAVMRWTGDPSGSPSTEHLCVSGWVPQSRA